MTRQILNKLRSVFAVLGIVGATAFTAVPTDGCDSTIKIVLEEPALTEWSSDEGWWDDSTYDSTFDDTYDVTFDDSYWGCPDSYELY
ncbi:MAG: hypothetical protein JXA69_11605 [Phycisphaerae bacterium]|nr:hypothetical protein [Phycisphaerae bacterium]